jgi:hypothetical protein
MTNYHLHVEIFSLIAYFKEYTLLYLSIEIWAN